MKAKRIKHVVFSRYEKLRWWFIDTEHPEEGEKYLISLRLSDFKYLLINGLYLLIPPLKKCHIKNFG